jgi:hypothetical protein
MFKNKFLQKKIIFQNTSMKMKNFQLELMDFHLLHKLKSRSVRFNIKIKSLFSLSMVFHLSPS